jgi:hypothetical protein
MGISVKSRKITLYVKSVKCIVGTEAVGVKTLVSGGPSVRPGGFRTVPPDAMYETEEVPEYEFVLAEDQKDFIETVKNVAGRLGFAAEIIDVTKENIFRREIQQEIEKIRAFPTLITDSGRRMEGKKTKEQLESFLTKR